MKPILLMHKRLRGATELPDVQFSYAPGFMARTVEDRTRIADDLSPIAITMAGPQNRGEDPDLYAVPYICAVDPKLAFRANKALLASRPEAFHFHLIGLDFDLCSDAHRLAHKKEIFTAADGPLTPGGVPDDVTHAFLPTLGGMGGGVQWLLRNIPLLRHAAVISPTRGGFRAFLLLDRHLTVHQWRWLLDQCYRHIVANTKAEVVGTKAFIALAGKTFCCLDMLTDPTRLMRVPFGYRGRRAGWLDYHEYAVTDPDMEMPVDYFGPLQEMEVSSPLKPGIRRTYTAHLPPRPRTLPVLDADMADFSRGICADVPSRGNRDNALYRKVWQTISAFPFSPAPEIFAMLLPLATALRQGCREGTDWQTLLWDKICRSHITIEEGTEEGEQMALLLASNMYRQQRRRWLMWNANHFDQALSHTDPIAAEADKVWGRLTSPERKPCVFLNLPPGFAKSELAKRWFRQQRTAIYATPTRAERDRIWQAVAADTGAVRYMSNADLVAETIGDDVTRLDLVESEIGVYQKLRGEWEEAERNGTISALHFGNPAAAKLTVRHPATKQLSCMNLFRYLSDVAKLISEEEAKSAARLRAHYDRDVYGPNGKDTIVASHVVLTHAALIHHLRRVRSPVVGPLRMVDRQRVNAPFPHALIIDEADPELLADPDRVDSLSEVTVYGNPVKFLRAHPKDLAERRITFDFFRHHSPLVLINASQGCERTLSIDGYDHEVVTIDRPLIDEDLHFFLAPELTTFAEGVSLADWEFDAEVLIPDRQVLTEALQHEGFTVLTNGRRYDTEGEVLSTTPAPLSATNRVNVIGKNYLVNSKVATLVNFPPAHEVADFVRVTGISTGEAIITLTANTIRQMAGRNTGWRSYARCLAYWEANGIEPTPHANIHVVILPLRLATQVRLYLDTLTTNVWTAWSDPALLPPAARLAFDRFTVSEATRRAGRRFGYIDAACPKLMHAVRRLAPHAEEEAVREEGMRLGAPQKNREHLDVVRMAALCLKQEPEITPQRLCNRINWAYRRRKVDRTIELSDAIHLIESLSTRRFEKGGENL